jgi:hypothetical protein
MSNRLLWVLKCTKENKKNDTTLTGVLFFAGALFDELAAARADVPVHGSLAADRAFFRRTFLNFSPTALAPVARVIVFSDIA